MTLAQYQAALAVSSVAAEALAQNAKQQRGAAAEASHVAVVAFGRLQAWPTAQQVAATEIDSGQAMLRGAQNAGDVAYLRQHGSEADCESIGRRVTARFKTPGKKWRE